MDDALGRKNPMAACQQDGCWPKRTKNCSDTLFFGSSPSIGVKAGDRLRLGTIKEKTIIKIFSTREKVNVVTSFSVSGTASEIDRRNDGRFAVLSASPGEVSAAAVASTPSRDSN